MATDERSAAYQPAPEILDACCGGRMWWWDKEHPLAVYMDVREAPAGSVGELTGRPEWNPNWSCEPDVLASFTAMPFADESFQMVVFDPPHVVREKQPPEGINGLKYGALPKDTADDDLRRGFAECWRVLRPGGTLIFKWAGDIKRVKPHFPATPIVGTRVPRGLQTWWLTFYKPLNAVVQESEDTRSLAEDVERLTAERDDLVRALTMAEAALHAA